MKLFLSPHNDDETLFGAFTIMREKPLVVVVFDSYVQVARGATFCDWETRRQETSAALYETLCTDPPVCFCGLRDDTQYTFKQVGIAICRELSTLLGGKCRPQLEHIFAPAVEENGHEQHNLVAEAASAIAKSMPAPLTHYATYTRTGGKTRTATPVPIEDPEWIGRKLRALACYKSQIRHPQCQEHFTRDLLEYYV